MTDYPRHGKRLFDIVVSLLLLLVLLPWLMACSLWLRLVEGSPVFYRETRLGQHHQPFTLIKFRTMSSSDRDSAGSSVATLNDSRIHTSGRILRRTHLDELPQLWNVLRGDMSLVGPRPYKPAHADRLPTDQLKRILKVRPGLTCSSALLFIAEDQVLQNCDNPETLYLTHLLPEKASQQLACISTMSLTGDIRILIQTILSLITPHARHHSQRYLHSLLKIGDS